MENKYYKKAKILTKFFNIYGYGNFDLTIEEIAFILELLETEKNYLNKKLADFYEKLEEQRMG